MLACSDTSDRQAKLPAKRWKAPVILNRKLIRGEEWATKVMVPISMVVHIVQNLSNVVLDSGSPHDLLLHGA